MRFNVPVGILYLGAVAVTLGAVQAKGAPNIGVAILGDSLSTGAATHPALAFDAKNLWDVFEGHIRLDAEASTLPESFRAKAVDALPAPQVLWPTPREFLGGPEWIWRHLVTVLSRAYLNTEEYSWGYLAALGLKKDPTHVAIAGENGARVDAMPRQWDRVFAATGGQLPPVSFVLYAGNDLCGATMEQVTTAAEFGQAIAEGIAYARRNGRPADGGSQIYVLSHLSVLQLLHDPSILEKKVFAHGETVTCRDLRRSHYGATRPARQADERPIEERWFEFIMPPNPAAFCPTLFATDGEDDRTLGALANRIRDYREATEAAVRDMEQNPPRQDGVKVHFLAGTGDLVFSGDDIAGDCFHLSVSGQAKVASAVLDSIEAETATIKAAP